MPTGIKGSWIQHPDFQLLKELYRDNSPLEDHKASDSVLIKCTGCENISKKAIERWLKGQRLDFSCASKLKHKAGVFAHLKRKPSENKQCSKCKELKPSAKFAANKRSADGRFSWCRECQARNAIDRWHTKYRPIKIERRRNNPKLAWCETALTIIKARAKRKNLIYSLTLDQLLQLTVSEKCVYCDSSLRFDGNNDTHKSNLASIDQLIPKAGYTLENTILCCARCNTIKNDATPEELFRIALRLTTLLQARLLTTTTTQLLDHTPVQIPSSTAQASMTPVPSGEQASPEYLSVENERKPDCC
jgi:hypothetical protein